LSLGSPKKKKREIEKRGPAGPFPSLPHLLPWFTQKHRERLKIKRKIEVKK
jgi:hypothetical protein